MPDERQIKARLSQTRDKMTLTKKLSPDDQKYLKALKAARLAIVTGGVSYSIGGRSLTRANLAEINAEIARLEGTKVPRFRQIIPRG